MELRLYSPSGSLAAVRDDAADLRASETVLGAGDCTVRFAGRVPAQCGGFLTVPGTRDGFVITSVTDAAGGGTVIRGASPLTLFDRAVIPDESAYEAPAAEILAAAARDHGAAALPLPLTVQIPEGTGTVAVTTGRCTVLTALREVCRAADCGMRLRFSPTGFTFTALPRVSAPSVLSDSLGTLLSLTRTAAAPGASRVFVESGDGVVVTVGTPASPVRDAWVTAPEITGARFGARLNAALIRRGEQFLAGQRGRETVTVTTDEEIPPGMLVPIRCADPAVRAEALCTSLTVTRGEGVTKRSRTFTVRTEQE